jgi:ABC-type dipeptide/oligopeptide/nickel transport system permease component
LISYIIRRLFQLVIVLVGVTLATFNVLTLVPGDAAIYLAG